MSRNATFADAPEGMRPYFEERKPEWKGQAAAPRDPGPETGTGR